MFVNVLSAQANGDIIALRATFDDALSALQSLRETEIRFQK